MRCSGIENILDSESWRTEVTCWIFDGTLLCESALNWRPPLFTYLHMSNMLFKMTCFTLCSLRCVTWSSRPWGHASLFASLRCTCGFFGWGIIGTVRRSVWSLNNATPLRFPAGLFGHLALTGPLLCHQTSLNIWNIPPCSLRIWVRASNLWACQLSIQKPTWHRPLIFFRVYCFPLS